MIAQGIEKGIAEYKKQQGKKSREIDKQRKQKSKRQQQDTSEAVEEPAINSSKQAVPWILLTLSWLGFAAYIGLYA